MSNKDKPALVPPMRFPKFRSAGGWTPRELGDCLDYRQPTQYLVASTAYNDSYEIPVVTAGKTFILGHTDETEGVFDEPLPVVIFDDFTTATQYVDFRFKAKSSAMKILLAKQNANIKFIYESMQQIDYEVGAHGRHWISAYSKIKVAVPKLDEQQKIADCLSSLDELITAQARKMDALKTHKKGLMQQLFPREGETQPRLRFPEFRNTGDWKLLPIGDNVELFSGYPFDGPDISQDSTGVPLLRGINVTEGRVRHNSEIDRYFTGSVEALEKYKLQLNDLVIGMDGSKVGKNSALITTADAGALLIQRVARLRAKSVDLIRFIFQQINSSTFHRYVDKINTSSGIPHISAKQINEFSIAFPSDQEQQRIADCLTSLDTLITAATQELETLKTHKKGLMQQLFPSAEAVEA